MTITDTPMSPYCQRWRDGRHTWRHRSEGGFDGSNYEVALIGDDTTAKSFVVQHHYSRSYPAARIRAGIYRGDALVGVAVFGIPMQEAVLTRAFPQLQPYDQALELSRFVLLDEVPANAESWFLRRAFRLAADAGLRGVVAFADPVPRVMADGTILSPGHSGTIYQASNGLFTADRGTPRSLLLGPDARVLSDRSVSKIRKQDRGHDYAEKQLVCWGATPRRAGEDPTAWLARALVEAGVRRMRHPGNYRYLFKLGRTRTERSRVVIALPAASYPKKVAG